jgi:predicted nucleic acid-binding protein
VIVVADSSPLIALAKIGCLDLLKNPYPQLCISREVYAEIVVDGAGMPGADHVANSDWIEVKPIQSLAGLIEASLKHRLGLGELSTILLGNELRAEIGAYGRSAGETPRQKQRAGGSWNGWSS